MCSGLARLRLCPVQVSRPQDSSAHERITTELKIEALTKGRLSAQASGELKLARLQKLQGGDLTPSKHSLSSTILQVEPDGNDPQIGYKALPQKSWYKPFSPACRPCLA